MSTFTLIMFLIAGPVNFVDGSIRYVTHVGEYGGQTWARWQYSATPNEFWDTIYFDQTPQRHLRYYNTVMPGVVVTFPQTIVFGVNDPPEEPIWGEGDTDIIVDYDDGTRCEGEVHYKWSNVRSGDRIIVTTVQDITITEGPCVAPLSYYESWAFSPDGVDATIGPNWALLRDGLQ